MTSHGFLNYSSRFWSQILLLPWWNNLNSNQAARSECQGTSVLLEMKLLYMMRKLVTWRGRWEMLFSPWRILTGIHPSKDRDGSNYQISILHPIFSILVISLQLTWDGEGVIPQLWCFPTDNFWGALSSSSVYLRKKIIFASLLIKQAFYF